MAEQAEQKATLDISKQARGAIIGAIVADAAARPLHWVYKSADLQAAIVDKDKNKLKDFAFLPENKCPFYELPTGSSSCYGDEFISTLQSIADNDNKFDIKSFKESLFKTFGGETNRYQTARKERESYPVKGPWLHGSMIDFCDKYEKKQDQTGSDHKDNDGVIPALSLTVILAAQARSKQDEAKKDEIEFPKEQVRATIEAVISNKDTVDRGMFLCGLVFAILTGDEQLPILIYALNEKFSKVKNETVYKEVNAVLDDTNVVRGDDGAKRDMDKKLKFPDGLKKVVEDDGYGKSCGNPGSFKAPLYNVIMNQKNYKQAVLDEIEAGGDSTGRGLISGCIVGAILGEDAIPKEWIEKTTKYEEVDKLLCKILPKK